MMDFINNVFVRAHEKLITILFSFYVDDGNGNVTFESFAGILRFAFFLKWKILFYVTLSLENSPVNKTILRQCLRMPSEHSSKMRRVIFLLRR